MRSGWGGGGVDDGVSDFCLSLPSSVVTTLFDLACLLNRSVTG